MAITTAHLKFYASERMTDNEDGGGQMSGVEIVSGADNQIFDDVSDVDRAVGDLSLRKIYAAVTSADTDKYLDSGVVVIKPPADENASVMLFSTGDYYDERNDWVSLLESSVSRGRRYGGWLSGVHIAGQRALLLWMRPGADEPPSAGSRLTLAALNAQRAETHAEYVWITKVTLSSRTITDSQGQFEVSEITCDLAYPLANAYTGVDPTRYDPSSTQLAALVYEVRYNPDLVTLSGIKPLALAADVGDYSLTVADGLYQPLIPTGLQETALADTTPSADHVLLVAGSADPSTTVTLVTTLNVVKPDGTVYLGSACQPGTLTLAVSGATITEANGVLTLGGVTDVGTIDYGNGLLRFNAACPSYGAASKTLTFNPAVKVVRAGQTASIRVTAENRGYVYVLSLAPLPTPSSLRVSYSVNKTWYTLYERGHGLLSGLDSRYGSGQLNSITGTVTITTGALPDVDSDILLVWGTQVEFTQRGNLTVNPIKIKNTLINGLPVRPGSLELSWDAVAVTDNGKGVLSGTGGAGTLDYQTGAWVLTPTSLPSPGAQISADYEYITNGVRGAAFLGTDIVDNLDGTLSLTLDATGDIEPGSVQITLTMIASGSPPAPATIDDGYRLSSAIPYASPTGQRQIYDDGLGGLVYQGAVIGTLDYETHVATWAEDFDEGPLPVTYLYRKYATVGDWVDPDTDAVVEKKDWVHTFYRHEETPIVYTGDQPLYNWAAHNLVTDFPDVAEELFTVNQLALDVTRGFEETVAGLEFSIGTSRFIEFNRQIFLNPNLETGAGTLAGTLDAATGEVRLNTWTGGVANSPLVKSLVTSRNIQLVNSVVFRTPVANIRPGSLQIRAYDEPGALISDTIPQSGILVNTHWTVSVDYPGGVVRIRFGRWKTVSALTPEELLEPWYDVDAIVAIGGVDKIWKPTLVRAESVIYNAVAQSILPPDRDMLGIDASRLPPDGQALIFQQGKLILVHHTDSLAQSNLSPTQVVDCGRVRLYRVVIEDSAGQRLPASFYTVNRELGTVTMAADLNLTGYTGPYALYHTVADLVRATTVDISGAISLNKPLSHDYPADDSYVSGVLYIGTLQARYTNLFAQAAWTSVWSDERIGDPPLAQYNDTTYPIQVANIGAYKDRILIRFTSSTAFQVIGEQLGVIATGNTSENCAPVNLLTGQPYFTIDYRGWGAGWATGNCVRFNLIGANYPVDLIRAIQPSNPTGLDDSVELCFIGNIDSA